MTLLTAKTGHDARRNTASVTCHWKTGNRLMRHHACWRHNRASDLRQWLDRLPLALRQQYFRNIHLSVDLQDMNDMDHGPMDTGEKGDYCSVCRAHVEKSVANSIR